MSEEEKKPPKKIFGVSRNVFSMGVVSFLNDLSSDMIFPYIPIFLTSFLGASATFVGAVEGIADATASVLKLASGRLSDRWRVRKPFVVFGYSLSAVAKPILAFAGASWHVLFVRFLDRVGKGTRDAPRDALISLSTDTRSIRRAFGFHRAADTFGAALGPLIAFLILPYAGGATEGGLRSLFLLSFAASVCAVVILLVFVRDIKNKNDSAPRSRFEFKFLGVSFIIFLSAATILALGRASDAFLLLRARDVGVELMLIPIIYFVFNITFSIFSTPAGILSDKIGHRNTFMIGILIFSGTYFFFAYAASAAAMWILFAVYGFYGALTEGVGRAIVADLVGEEWRATAFGMYNAFTGLAALPAGIVFGLLWDSFGARASFLYGAYLGLFSFLLFLILRMRNHVHERRAAIRPLS